MNIIPRKVNIPWILNSQKKLGVIKLQYVTCTQIQNKKRLKTLRYEFE